MEVKVLKPGIEGWTIFHLPLVEIIFVAKKKDEFPPLQGEG